MNSSNCNKCEYKSIGEESERIHGWCYMFKNKTAGVCGQYKKTPVRQIK